jgi:uncharacterized protein
MMRLANWQWALLALPLGAVLSFVLGAAAVQIHAWHLSWIWAVFGLVLVLWRWLLVRWTQPAIAQLDQRIAELAADLPDAPASATIGDASGSPAQRVEAALQEILVAAREDPPVWADWQAFWRRCLSLISAIAQVYKPETQQPLLNIYVPQAYNLLRGTVDDMDEWMEKMSPVLNQLTIEQAVQAYEIYQKFQPAARRMLQAWGAARWLFNPIAAATNVATQGTRSKANQELLGNLNQLARETVLRKLAQQAIRLYSGQTEKAANDASVAEPTAVSPPTTLKSAQLPVLETPIAPNATLPSPIVPSPIAKSIQQLLLEAQPATIVTEKPVNLLVVGRTGAGKSRLINGLFVAPVAAVDALPSTDRLQDYHWTAPTGESLVLWDSPGYEQVNADALRDRVLAQVDQADTLLLVTPAADPALQMDTDFLVAARSRVPDLPIIAVVSQVDRLRPQREWQPPYNWANGNRPKEISIREAIAYRQEVLTGIAGIFPIAFPADDPNLAWGIDQLTLTLLAQLDPAQQLRFARFLRSIEARTQAATQVIDRYAKQMTTQQGLAAFLKSPALQLIARFTASSPAAAAVLAEQLPIEQLPLIVGKVQMAHELHGLFQDQATAISFDWPTLWPLFTDCRSQPDRNAAACGYSLIAYWSGTLTSAQQLHETFRARC